MILKKYLLLYSFFVIIFVSRFTIIYTKAGLQRARASGKRIGRLPGQKPTKYKLSAYKQNIAIQLDAGKSIYSLAKIYGVRWQTMKNFLIREQLYNTDLLQV